MYTMQVTYVLCLFYCLLPLAVYSAGSWGYCNFQGETSQWAFCRSRMVNRTFDFIPTITEPVTHIIFDDQPLKQLPLNAFRNVSSQKELTHIDLGNCQINHIDADAFLHLYKLEHLSLNRNNITHFASGTFQHASKLKYMYVAKNMIKQLQTGLFENLIQLNSVSFYQNRLTVIEPGTFRNTPALVYINLVENKLQYLDPLFKDGFVNVTELHLNGNPWNCDCKLREVFEIHQLRRPVGEYTEPVCQDPAALRGRKWLDLTGDAFKCDAQIISPVNDTRAVVLGTSVTMSCAVQGDPAPTMQWSRGSNMIPLDTMSITSNMNMHYLNYTFTVQDEEDLGVYQCVANNTGAVQVSSTTLTMNMTAPDIVTLYTELVVTEPVPTSREFDIRIREPVPAGASRALDYTITLSEPGIIVKESGTRIRELSRASGSNATTTVEVRLKVVLELPKNVSWLTNVHVTPVRVAYRAN